MVSKQNFYPSNLFTSFHRQVASGLPERSDVNKHVSEIATMALDLLHASSYFKVPHSTSEKVQIRIGIHTGSCGAGKILLNTFTLEVIYSDCFSGILGIVGTKMPRYCLFGKERKLRKSSGSNRKFCNERISFEFSFDRISKTLTSYV
jgi:Adenylate and Guanylate cyclase catalytic domain